MKKLEVILAFAAVVTGAVATNLWLDLRAERGKAAEIAILQTAAESMQRAQAAAPQPPAPAMPVAAATSPQTVAAPASQQSAARTANSPMKGMLDAMTALEGSDAMRTRKRAAMSQRYQDIEQELGITDQEKQKLFDLLSDEDEDFAGMMLAFQDPAAAREMQRKMVEAERAQEAKVSALLGSRYPKWEEYQGTVAARTEVDQLRRTLGASENPLSESQSRQLVTAFAAEKGRASKEDREWNQSSAALNSPNVIKESMQRVADSRNRLVDVASPILNSAQLDRYKKSAEQEASMMRATMEMLNGGGKP